LPIILPLTASQLCGLISAGVGESTGSISDTTVSRRLKELMAVVAFARQHPSLSTRLGLLGSSLGGYVSLLYAAQDPSVKALSVWAASYNLMELRHKFQRKICSG